MYRRRRRGRRSPHMTLRRRVGVDIKVGNIRIRSSATSYGSLEVINVTVVTLRFRRRLAVLPAHFYIFCEEAENGKQARKRPPAPDFVQKLITVQVFLIP